MSEVTMNADKLRYIVLHTAGAAAFIFILNRFVLGTSWETSIVWAFAFGAMAAGLAWQHTKR